MLSRRAFLRRLPGSRRPQPPASDGITFDSPVITPIGRFYRQSVTGRLPVIDRRAWALVFDGLVRRPLKLGYEALRRQPAAGDVFTLVSAMNPPGGGLIGNAAWRGCRLADLLLQADLLPEATHLRFEAADGYSATVALDEPGLPQALLAYDMNGALLPPEHGGPLRALVPDLYGGASVKWLTRITAIEARQASGAGIPPVRTGAQIMTPRPYTVLQVGQPVAVQGVAFAGLRGIAAVGLSVDGGDWMPVTLRPPESPLAWTQWYTLWTPEVPGEYRLVVRATDRTGRTQDRLAGLGLNDSVEHNAGGSRDVDPMHWIVVRVIG
ncbi:MAG: molybdopterin-dependent oxidoreductase [Anaerolineae bacterium]|nr:molybdopterin-dependent oxidoreductase [Anaerolineae bacterium]